MQLSNNELDDLVNPALSTRTNVLKE